VSRRRIDAVLVERGLFSSRERAGAAVLAGEVRVGGEVVTKAGHSVADDAVIEVAERQQYVSRGGQKLAGALDAFGFDVSGLRVVDVGASTGGFTDCVLQRGARSVCAVDVGYGQLAQKLRDDLRVQIHERTNARTLTPLQIGGAVDLVVVDASFIGLGKLMPAVARCLAPGGELVALVKPQFEVGREEAARSKGVVRDPEVRARAIAGAEDDVKAAGLALLGTCDSSLEGPKGNLEAFVHARKP